MFSNNVGPGYFATMGIPLVAGRDFDARDMPESVPVAIVNEVFAAKFGGPRLRSDGASREKRHRRSGEDIRASSASSADSTLRLAEGEPYPVVVLRRDAGATPPARPAGDSLAAGARSRDRCDHRRARARSIRGSGSSTG